MLSILLLQIGLLGSGTTGVEPGIEVEILSPLKEAIEHQLQEGGVEVVKGDEVESLQGAKGGRVLGSVSIS